LKKRTIRQKGQRKMKKRQENEKKTEKWQTVLGKVLNSEDKAEK
jgi:hypothetical protein